MQRIPAELCMVNQSRYVQHEEGAQLVCLTIAPELHLTFPALHTWTWRNFEHVCGDCLRTLS